MAPAPTSLRMHYHRTIYIYLLQRLTMCNHERCKRRPRCAMGGLRHTFLRHAVVMSHVKSKSQQQRGFRIPTSFQGSNSYIPSGPQSNSIGTNLKQIATLTWTFRWTQCSRLKSSMPFKLQKILLAKQPFKTQPQIENEDDIT